MNLIRGISRHIVRFVEYDGTLYALKELPERPARREWTLLRRLEGQGLPVVEAVGIVTGRGDDLDAVLITRHLEYSLPYRALFSGRGIPDLRTHLLNGLVELLARLHLRGFFWGDCSLSNALFRRDAGALTAYLVDAETGELHGAALRRAAALRPRHRAAEHPRRAARRRRRGRPARRPRPGRDRRRRSSPATTRSGRS